jgi:hypothetical protein
MLRGNKDEVAGKKPLGGTASPMVAPFFGARSPLDRLRNRSVRPMRRGSGGGDHFYRVDSQPVRLADQPALSGLKSTVGTVDTRENGNKPSQKCPAEQAEYRRRPRKLRRGDPFCVAPSRRVGRTGMAAKVKQLLLGTRSGE